MSVNDNIRYLQNQEINRDLWDRCIDQADNSLIYAYSFYLDTMATGWDALVLNNYEAVFPLTYRVKWGIAYLYQPFAVAQLGLFGKNIDADLLHLFLQNIPEKFKYWAINLNAKNLPARNSLSFTIRSNYYLELNHSYQTLYSQYSDNI